MPSSNDIATLAFRDTGSCAIGESPSNNELAEGFVRLNNIVDTLATQRLAIYVTQPFTYPLVVNQQNYSIGPGGNFNQARPLWIPQVGWVKNAGSSQEIEIPVDILTVQEWRDMVTKGTPGAFISKIWYEPTSPLGTIWPWPIYSGSGDSVRIYCPVAVTAFPDQTTSLTFPPGYVSALEWLLAEDLLSVSGAPPAIWEIVRERAADKLAWVKRSNVTVGLNDLRVDSALVAMSGPGRWNPYTGEYDG